jgi:hypothetical protein
MQHQIEDNRDGDTDYFGWSHFVCASPEARKDYLVAQVGSHLTSTLPISVTTLIMTNIFGVSEWGSIDHQSAWNFPRAPRRGFSYLVPEPLSWDFLNEFSHWFLNTQELAVLGGNDNGDEGHPALDRAKKVLELSWLTDNYKSFRLLGSI